MVELGLAVRAGVVDAPVDDPVLASVQVDVHAVDDADAFHDAVLVAAVLAAHEFDLERVALVQHRVVEDQAGVPAAADQVPDGPPDGIRRHVVLHEVAVDGIMRENRLVLGHVGLRIVDQTGNYKLAIIPSFGSYNGVFIDAHGC